MKPSASRQRWALSFADLALLLLGFFVLLQAKPDANHLSAGLRAAFGARADAAFDQPARLLFEPGEAILTPKGQQELREVAGQARGAALIISSRGTEAGTARFDGWELAAARTAAIARALAAAGVRQDKIAVAIDPSIGRGQTIQITRD